MIVYVVVVERIEAVAIVRDSRVERRIETEQMIGPGKHVTCAFKRGKKENKTKRYLCRCNIKNCSAGNVYNIDSIMCGATTMVKNVKRYAYENTEGREKKSKRMAYML